MAYNSIMRIGGSRGMLGDMRKIATEAIAQMEPSMGYVLSFLFLLAAFADSTAIAADRMRLAQALPGR